MTLLTDIRRHAERIAPEITALRRELHTIPERSFTEHKTAKRIERELARHTVGAVRRLGDTGLVADIAGAAPEPLVALRADIDALPMTESAALPYRSTHDGFMHACGHDGHAAILVGAGRVLQQIASRLPGSVRLIFQPAEEGGAGAREMCKLGAMDSPRPQAIYALHGRPALAVGKVMTTPGAHSASTDTFAIVVEGKAAHGAYPHLGRDALTAASAIVLALQQIVSRRIKPFDPAVVTVGKIEGGTAVNIIASTVRLAGTLRARDAKVRKELATLVRSIAQQTAIAWGAKARFNITEGYPIVMNDADCVERVRETAVALGGPKNFEPAADLTMGGEDFSFYLDYAPGCLFRLGLHDAQHKANLHQVDFDFNDKAIPAGIAMMAGVACRQLGLQLA